MNKIIHGDCLEKLKELEENSVDSIVCDPPYELGFMGKSWDNTGIANNKEMWAECLRVLKPGGHLLAFSGTRTYHRMASAIEDAGFEVRDMVEWVYGSGFPKSLNIGKKVDELQGNERVVVGTQMLGGNAAQSTKEKGGTYASNTNAVGVKPIEVKLTKGTSEWEGWGTALKPSHEPICMARKPLSEKTVAENCLKWGTGGINIDESRVDTNGEEVVRNFNDFSNQHGNKFGNGEPIKTERSEKTTDGRWPANLIHDNSEEVRECFPETKSGKLKSDCYEKDRDNDSIFAGGENFTHKGYEADSGNASRFFKSIIYQAKASKSERNKGCEGLEEKVRIRQGLAGEHKDTISSNSHPTVKPIALMEYLIKMVTKPGGVVLDPFAGSGTTLVAAKKNGYNYIGIELTEEYIPIIKARLSLPD